MEWLFLFGAAVLIALFAWGIMNENRQRKAMTEEEWEQRERGVSLLGAGALGLHKVLHSDLEKAVATQEDMRQGMLPSAEHEDNRAKQQEARGE